jgi:hypothetical protein
MGTAAKPGIGHNKGPLTSEVPPKSEVPPISSWQTIDESTGLIARQTADRQRGFIAATSSGMVAPVGPPSLFAGDPNILHAEMLKRIAALEETIAKLTSGGGDQIEQRALRIEEVKNELNTLKTQSPVPENRPNHRRVDLALASALAMPDGFIQCRKPACQSSLKLILLTIGEAGD